MAETFEAYRSRVLSYLGDKEPIGVQQATSSQLDRRLRDVVPEEFYGVTYAGGGNGGYGTVFKITPSGAAQCVLAGHRQRLRLTSSTRRRFRMLRFIS